MILTSGVGAPRDFKFLLEPCEDLLDELLDILIENSWREEEELVPPVDQLEGQDDRDRKVTLVTQAQPVKNSHKGKSKARVDKELSESIVVAIAQRDVKDWTYQDWLQAAEEDEAEMRIWKRLDRSSGNSSLGSVSTFSVDEEAEANGTRARTEDLAVMESSHGKREEPSQNDKERSNSIPSLSGSSSSPPSSTESPSPLRTSTSLPMLTVDYFTSLSKERLLNRKAATAMVILNIFLNASFCEENLVFFNKHSRFWDVISSLLEEGESDARKWEQVKKEWSDRENPRSPGTKATEEKGPKKDSLDLKLVFTVSEHLRIRKDVLSILSNLSDPSIPLSQKPRSTNLTIWRLLKSFLLDDRDINDPCSKQIYCGPSVHLPPVAPGAILPMTSTSVRIPYYLDLSFEAFSKLAQPDPNREVLSTMLSDNEIIELLMTSLRRLPMEKEELMVLCTECGIGHCSRILLSIYSLVFLSNQNLKKKIRKFTMSVLPITLVKLMRHLLYAYGDFRVNNFKDIIYTILEILKLVDQCNDTLGDVPGLFGNQDVDDNQGKSKNRNNLPGLLIGLDEEVQSILNALNIHPSIVADLQQMNSL